MHAIRECLGRGWGCEIDVRGGKLTHEPGDGESLWDLQDTIGLLLLNIKEASDTEELIDFAKKRGQCLIFDMELIGVDPAAIPHELRMPREAMNGCAVWQDRPMRRSAPGHYCVSPELHILLGRKYWWSVWKKDGVAGICTDYPEELDDYLHSV